MKTKDSPHGIVRFNFAQAMLAGDFDTAYDMLSWELKLKYSAEDLKKRFDDMMDLATNPVDLGETGVPEIAVLDNSEPGNSLLDDKSWAYVAIWTEAVTVTVKPFEGELLITTLEWGRP
jgi:hypothetical protein